MLYGWCRVTPQVVLITQAVLNHTSGMVAHSFNCFGFFTFTLLIQLCKCASVMLQRGQVAAKKVL